MSQGVLILITLIVNAIITPLLVIGTTKIKDSVDKDKRRERRDDNFIAAMEKRIMNVEKELREVRVELKNRDAEYLILYKEHTTLKAKHEVLEVDHSALKDKYDGLEKDHDTLRIQYNQTATELKRLGTGIAT